VYGGLSTVLELDAMHRESAVHAGTVVVPAVLALASTRKLGGREVLKAILKGSEAAFRVGRAAGPSHYKIYQNTATCGGYGSAFAVGSLLGLSETALVHALGNAGTQSSGLWEYRETGALTKQLHAGKAAESGVIAAQLATRGFTGPLKILEGARGFFKAACPDANPSAVLRGRDDAWGLLGMSIKPWPSSRHTHPAIEAALGVAPQVRGRQIETVDVQTYQTAVDLCGKPARNAHHGKSSIQYCVAAALSDAAVSNASYDDEAYRRYARLLPRITIRAVEPYASAYPKAWGAGVLVTFADGSTATFGCTNVKGDPEAPMSEDEMKSKAAASLRLGGVSDVSRYIEAVLAMSDDAPVPRIPIALSS
jgi:2-methylcitrate dehydratase PrpD